MPVKLEGSGIGFGVSQDLAKPECIGVGLAVLKDPANPECSMFHHKYGLAAHPHTITHPTGLNHPRGATAFRAEVFVTTHMTYTVRPVFLRPPLGNEPLSFSPAARLASRRVVQFGVSLRVVAVSLLSRQLCSVWPWSLFVLGPCVGLAIPVCCLVVPKSRSLSEHVCIDHALADAHIHPGLI